MAESAPHSRDYSQKYGGKVQFAKSAPHSGDYSGLIRPFLKADFMHIVGITLQRYRNGEYVPKSAPGGGDNSPDTLTPYDTYTVGSTQWG